MTTFFSSRNTLACMATAAVAQGVVPSVGAAPALLDRPAWDLLAITPERATMLGVDGGCARGLAAGA